MQTRDRVLDFLQVEIQDALDQIQRNLDTMTDSKGRTKVASGLMNRGVYGYNGSPIKEMKTQFKVTIKMEDYAMYIDKGVRGAKSTYPSSVNSPYKFTNKMPPWDLMHQRRKGNGIRSWMLRKGIVPRDAKGQKINSEKARNRLAKMIAKKVYEAGIEGVPFYSSVINLEFDKKILRGLELAGEKGINNDIDKFFRAHALRITKDSNGNIIAKVS